MSSTENGRGRSILIKSLDDILVMHEANQIVAETLTMLKDVVEPGISTWELDQLAEKNCLKQ